MKHVGAGLCPPMLKDKALDKEKIIDLAKKAMERAYAPYSNFKVGAALRTKDGHVFTGSNVESASYALSICAERAAVAKAVSEGHRDFDELVIVTDTEEPTSPCGACRQVLSEFSPDLSVRMIALKDGEKRKSLRELFPDPFRLKPRV